MNISEYFYIFSFNAYGILFKAILPQYNPFLLWKIHYPKSIFSFIFIHISLMSEEAPNMFENRINGNYFIRWASESRTEQE